MTFKVTFLLTYLCLLVSTFAPLPEPIFHLDASSCIFSDMRSAYSHRSILRHYCCKPFSFLLMFFIIVWLKFIKTVELLKIVQKSHFKSKTMYLMLHTIRKKTLILYQLAYVALQGELYSSLWSHRTEYKNSIKTLTWAYCVLCPWTTVLKCFICMFCWGSSMKSAYFSEMHPA